MKYYLSLGSNIKAEENIAFAIAELKKILTNIAISSTHQTSAEGFEGDDFLNLVLAGDSDCLLYTTDSAYERRSVYIS